MEPDEPEEPEESESEGRPQMDTSNLLLIVVGAHLRAEMADRPLANRLRDAIEQWVAVNAEALAVTIIPVVCCDVWYMHDEQLQKRPTVSIGGPGVNALSAYYGQRINPTLLEDNQIFIQLDPEFVDLRACIWGMNHDQTVEALELFIQEYLDGFLRAVATQVEPEG